MRKPLLALFLALSLTLGLAACGSTPAPEADNAASDSAPSESTPQTEASGGVLVAYFSATGNTEGVAQQLAGLLSADLYAITPAEPYTEEDLDYTNPNSRSQVEGSDPDARPGPQGRDGTGAHQLQTGGGRLRDLPVTPSAIPLFSPKLPSCRRCGRGAAYPGASP